VWASATQGTVHDTGGTAYAGSHDGATRRGSAVDDGGRQQADRQEDGSDDHLDDHDERGRTGHLMSPASHQFGWDGAVARRNAWTLRSFGSFACVLAKRSAPAHLRGNLQRPGETRDQTH
jgi:hypothetical protein